VIEQIREETGALVVLHTPNLVLPFIGAPRAAHLAVYRDAVQEIAKETGAPCVDHFARWQAESEGTLHHWLVDGFHPNEYGHRALARSLFEALGIWDPAGSLTCQLPIPRLPSA
jgi:lysophospholipase L1-like esterase